MKPPIYRVSVQTYLVNYMGCWEQASWKWYHPTSELLGQNWIFQVDLLHRTKPQTSGRLSVYRCQKIPSELTPSLILDNFASKRLEFHKSLRTWGDALPRMYPWSPYCLVPPQPAQPTSERAEPAAHQRLGCAMWMWRWWRVMRVDRLKRAYCRENYMDMYLVGGLEHFFHILGIIIPTD